ncbi:hypothetical protein GW17_00059890 [Ensete ventricosum]|nr:hypothetical protein GW17_00059890 [Ensete ventricosum]RZS05362.1 hypothetical protein BHM03_00035862 [Ensete ventricosum]
MEATINSSTEPLLPSRALYAHSLSQADDKLRGFQSSLKSICVNQSDARNAMVSWSLFLLGVFVSTSYFVLFYACTLCAYNMVV